MTASPTTGIDTRDMVVVHDSIRRQFGQAPDLDLLGALLHHHHVGEDRLLWPVLQPRVPADVAATVARMESQHDGIAEAQATVTTAVAAWRADAGEDEREALATSWEGLLARITEHLAARGGAHPRAGGRAHDAGGVAAAG